MNNEKIPRTHTHGLVLSNRGIYMIEDQYYRLARHGEVPTLWADEKGVEVAHRAYLRHVNPVPSQTKNK